MTARMKLLLPAGALLAGWLSFTGCQHAENPPPEKVLRPTTGPWTPTEARLYSDIMYAQDIEHHESGMPRPDEPIHFEAGTDSSHRAYYFANLRALRFSIKHRMDSLRRAGVELSYDTLGGATSHGRLRIIPDDSIEIFERQIRQHNQPK